MDDDQVQISADLFFSICDYFFSPPVVFEAAEELQDKICDGLRDTLTGIDRDRGWGLQ